MNVFTRCAKNKELEFKKNWESMLSADQLNMRKVNFERNYRKTT